MAADGTVSAGAGASLVNPPTGNSERTVEDRLQTRRERGCSMLQIREWRSGSRRRKKAGGVKRQTVSTRHRLKVSVHQGRAVQGTRRAADQPPQSGVAGR